MTDKVRSTTPITQQASSQFASADIKKIALIALALIISLGILAGCGYGLKTMIMRIKNYAHINSVKHLLPISLTCVATVCTGYVVIHISILLSKAVQDGLKNQKKQIKSQQTAPSTAHTDSTPPSLAAENRDHSSSQDLQQRITTEQTEPALPSLGEKSSTNQAAEPSTIEPITLKPYVPPEVSLADID